MALIDRALRSPAEPASSLGPGAIAMYAFLGICAVVTVVAEGELADAAGALGVLVGAAVTGRLFLARARSLDGRERFGWSMIGVGMLVAASGVLVVAVVFFTVGDAPSFGWPDLFFFATYATMVVGFASLPHMQGSPLERGRMVLDGLIGAVSIGALLWVYLVSDVIHDLETAPIGTRIIGSVYPFLDLLALTVAMLILLRRSAHRFDIRFALFAIGIVAQVVGDVIFLASAATGSFEDAEPFYAMNLLAMAMFFSAASLIGVETRSREYADRDPPLWTVVAPYLPAIGMLFVFLFETFVSREAEVNMVLLGATVLVGLLVITRQGVAIVENRTFIEQQRNALVSTISHELRTPLTSIVGFVELLEEDDGSMSRHEERQMIGIVHDQADYMSRIVSDLIMLARGTGEDLRLDVEPVSMADLASSAIRASGIAEGSVRLECDPGLVGFVDAARIQQVLVNLLTNASRYGGPQRLVQIASEGSALVIEVHDDGPGIPRRHELRVWERFERGPNRFNAAVPGSGIGLAIVRAIADAHGGTAEYRCSEILGGACFAVVLPGRTALEDRTWDVLSGVAVPLGHAE